MSVKCIDLAGMVGGRMVSARTKNILRLCLNLKFMCMHAIKQFATGGILVFEHNP